MKHPDLRTAMGRNGQAYVRTHYAWDVILSKYERLLARVRQPIRDLRPRR
jgi:glycosyltransferase involved in cell wall biosynthesis